VAAAPRGGPQYRTAVKRSVQARSVTTREVPAQVLRGKQQLGRAFVVLAMPVLLMLGSVYVHTVAARLEGEVARLEEQKNMAEGEGERLEAKLTELSQPGRIRAQAKENLGMRDPGKDLYGSNGEDVADDGGEKDKALGQ
jgi:cell division protein FtsL